MLRPAAQPVSPSAEPSVVRGESGDPESEAVLADSVGVALLVVLDTLTPAERLAFVHHDLFAMPFDEIGSIVRRSPAAAKQLASRARRRVRGSSSPSDANRVRQRDVVEAGQEGDVEETPIEVRNNPREVPGFRHRLLVCP